MHIKIPEKCTPFTHSFGERVLLPGSLLGLEIYPCLIKVFDYSSSDVPLLDEIKLDIQGPFDGPKGKFTVQQDLDKSYIRVWSDTADGFFRYTIRAIPDTKKISIQFEKKPKDISLHSSLLAEISEQNSTEQKSYEKLFFGCHKQQDWDLVKRRIDLEEFLPFLFTLAQKIPVNNLSAEQKLSEPSLLSAFQKLIENKNQVAVFPAIKNLFLAGFEGVLAPRLVDNDYQGYPLPIASFAKDVSPCYLLTESAKYIKNMFIQFEGNLLDVLPVLPPELPHGRYINIDCADLGKLDIEWSKKIVRRMVFYSNLDGELTFVFHKGIRSYRLRQGNKDKGIICENRTQINVIKGNEYYFDNFR